jgi:hypothetical protein
MQENAMAATVLYVSNISFVNSGPQYFLLHRSTGKPLEGSTGANMVCEV